MECLDGDTHVAHVLELLGHTSDVLVLFLEYTVESFDFLRQECNLGFELSILSTGSLELLNSLFGIFELVAGDLEFIVEFSNSVG